MPTNARQVGISLATIVVAGALVAALVGNLATAFASRKNCQRIEALYERVRVSAIRSVEELPETAETFGLPPPSPEAIARAERLRDRTLREFEPPNCSIWIWRE